MVYNVIAILLSAYALTTSAYLALQHRFEQRRANLLPYYTRLIDEFRTLEFHDHYGYLCTRLRVEHDPQLGISGLPDDARRAIYHVAYLFQGIGMARTRNNSTTGTYLLRTMEELAGDVRRLPPNAHQRDDQPTPPLKEGPRLRNRLVR
ncbi:MAG: hypothetical protein JWP48_1917 [Actinoallomurus sp.]|jgi:hypothetical protein|nr:hypothetical protein [Actinoallomurus sp.]